MGVTSLRGDLELLANDNDLCNVLSYGATVHFESILTVYHNACTLGLTYAVNTLEQCAFARTVIAEHRKALPSLKLKAHILKHFSGRAVV